MGQKKLEQKYISTISEANFSWVNVKRVTEAEMGVLGKNYNFSPLDLKECLPPLQRPKLILRDNYLFLILVFPVFNRKTRLIEPAEVDFFIGKDFIITVHDSKIQALEDFFELLETNQAHRQTLFQNPAHFFFQLLDELLDSCFPMLFHISNDIESVEKQVLIGYSQETIHEILRIKNNLVVFQKAMQPHRDLLLRLQNLLPQFFPIENFLHYARKLIDHCKEIWDNLEIYNRAIDGLHQTHTTLISFRLNELIKILTIFSVVLFVSSVVVSLFSIRAPGTPFVDEPLGFWKIILLIVALILIMIGIFKNRKWL